METHDQDFDKRKETPEPFWLVLFALCVLVAVFLLSL